MSWKNLNKFGRVLRAVFDICKAYYGADTLRDSQLESSSEKEWRKVENENRKILKSKNQRNIYSVVVEGGLFSYFQLFVRHISFESGSVTVT